VLRGGQAITGAKVATASKYNYIDGHTLYSEKTIQGRCMRK